MTRCHILPSALENCDSVRVAEKPYTVIDMNAPLYFMSPDGKFSSVEHTSYGPMSLNDAKAVAKALNGGVDGEVYDTSNWYETEYTKKYQKKG